MRESSDDDPSLPIAYISFPPFVNNLTVARPTYSSGLWVYLSLGFTILVRVLLVNEIGAMGW